MEVPKVRRHSCGSGAGRSAGYGRLGGHQHGSSEQTVAALASGGDLGAGADQIRRAACRCYSVSEAGP